MKVPSSRSEVRITGELVLGHIIFWIVLPLGLFLILFLYVGMFGDRDVKLPWMTELLIGLSRWFGQYWMALPFLILILLALDGGVLLLLRTRPGTKVLSWLWFALMLFAPLVAVVLICLLG